MKRAICAATLMMSMAIASSALAQGPAAPPDPVKACETCHGPAGNGTAPATPRLNGQLAAYIVNRLKELGDLTRNSPDATMAMHDIAHIKDSLKTAVADYFSHQAPTPPKPQAGKLAAMGERLYLNGDPAHGLAACQSCHGAKAEGQGNAPRLGGQHRDYLKKQLWNFNFVMREHPVMNANATKLDGDQIDGLAAYLGAD